MELTILSPGVPTRQRSHTLRSVSGQASRGSYPVIPGSFPGNRSLWELYSSLGKNPIWVTRNFFSLKLLPEDQSCQFYQGDFF
jgi:hypothetical protein